MWKDGKPEPFEHLRKRSKCAWERSKHESHCDFVDRLHQQWEELERETERDILGLASNQTYKPTTDKDGEITYVEFVWNGRNVRCESFFDVDLDDPKDMFKSSKIFDNFNKKMAKYDNGKVQEKMIRTKLVQHITATKATEAKLATEKDMKELIEWAYEEMDRREPDQWENGIADGERALAGERVYRFPMGRGVYKSRYTAVIEKWEGWGSGTREWTKDKKMINDRNLFASNPKNQILRRPSVNGDAMAIYMAFDKKNKLIIFLDPQGIPWSYNEAIHKLMKEDAHEFYSNIKPPNPKSNKRHVSQREHLKQNPALKPHWCGSDHYGHWHAQQHTHDPLLETGDFHGLNATQRQLLLQFLHYTGGPMTRVLDFWFGVWDPKLRQRYRDIYAKSPKFARLPPVNTDHPDTYCLRVSVCNRPTDEHRDQNDIRGGLTGLVQLGDFKGTVVFLSDCATTDLFTGAAMCFNKLGIALDGYGDGAVLLLRGTELRHYTSQWSGNCRYAFDHTTHQSVENAVKVHEEFGRWAPKKEPAEHKATKGAKDSKRPDEEDDNKPDSGDAPGKPQRKTRKRSRDDEEDGPSAEPAPKKSKTKLPVRQRQVRTKK